MWNKVFISKDIDRMISFEGHKNWFLMLLTYVKALHSTDIFSMGWGHYVLWNERKELLWVLLSIQLDSVPYIFTNCLIFAFFSFYSRLFNILWHKIVPFPWHSGSQQYCGRGLSALRDAAHIDRRGRSWWQPNNCPSHAK